MHKHWKYAIFTAALFISTESNAAALLDLKNIKSDVLRTFATDTTLRGAAPLSLKEEGRFIDSTQTMHVRVQEYYRGYPIWNAHAVVHTPTAKTQQSLNGLLTATNVQKTMNGHLYQNLQADLDKASQVVTTAEQMKRAEKFALADYQNNASKHVVVNAANVSSQLLIFIDKKQEAHWAYKINFSAAPGVAGQLPAKPNYVIDAITFKIYRAWDDIKTAVHADEFVRGGGLGGNPKAGKFSYDGLSGHLAMFNVTRTGGVCYLQNNDMKITHYVTNDVMHYACPTLSAEHNNIYWSEDFDTVNQGYSPANDAMFAAQVLKRFYQEWYGVPVLKNADGSVMQLHMVVHVLKMDNAYWDGEQMVFGDGTELYPLTSLGVAAHEVSHGFTGQHSNLEYQDQSGGMNEAFSDMAAQTAEFYAYGKSSWQIGSEIFKLDGESMRYMDQPSKDCYGKAPGSFCSIDSAEQYYDGLDVHLSSGIYNRAFYLLSTTQGWTPRKAFEVMLQANASYWIPATQFADGAACVIKAAEDLKYNAADVKQAFLTVGVTPDARCTN
jgi:pseudolysin